jgi:cell division protein FtsI/penicillin-binding protein 2
VSKLILQRKRAGDLLDPIVVRTAATGSMLTYLEERAAAFPGLTLARSYIRRYPYGSLAAQLLGYDGQIPQGDPRLGKDGYEPGDVIGLTGIERGLDMYLRGVPGLARVRVDSLGRPRSERHLATPPQPGQSVRLTINAQLQVAAQNALQYGIQLARNKGNWAADGGAIVALSPKDGSILAMASSPSYDPSVYSGRVTNRKLAAQGLTTGTALARNYPGIDRALDGTYPPGSTFKPLTAIAGLQEHLIKPYAFYPARHAPRRRTRRIASSTTGTASSTRGWICRRRSRSRATRTSTASPISSICCRRTEASRSSTGPAPSDSGGQVAPTSLRRHPESCRRPPGSTVCSRGTPTRRTGGSIGFGSRATRSTSRSARATCS